MSFAGVEVQLVSRSLPNAVSVHVYVRGASMTNRSSCRNFVFAVTQSDARSVVCSGRVVVVLLCGQLSLSLSIYPPLFHCTLTRSVNGTLRSLRGQWGTTDRGGKDAVASRHLKLLRPEPRRLVFSASATCDLRNTIRGGGEQRHVADGCGAGTNARCVCAPERGRRQSACAAGLRGSQRLSAHWEPLQARQPTYRRERVAPSASPSVSPSPN